MHAATCINIQPESFFNFQTKNLLFRIQSDEGDHLGRFTEKNKEFWPVPISLMSAFAGHNDHLLEFWTDQKERLKT